MLDSGVKSPRLFAGTNLRVKGANLCPRGQGQVRAALGSASLRCVIYVSKYVCAAARLTCAVYRSTDKWSIVALRIGGLYGVSWERRRYVVKGSTWV